MLGTTNAKYNADYEFTPDNAVELTFTAGGRIDKGDLVEILAEDLDALYPPYGQDTNGQYLGTFSMPSRLDNNKFVYQAFHMNTNDVQQNTNLYSTMWKTTTYPVTYQNTIGSVNTLLSQVPAYNWAEPLYIGDGYWIVGGEGSGSTGVVDKNGKSYNYPSQILLIHVDQTGGLASRADVIYTDCNWNESFYGKPIVLRVTENNFIFAYRVYLNGIYQIYARSFKVIKGDKYGTGTVEWMTDGPVSLYVNSGKFVFYGNCCNFVYQNHISFLLADNVTYCNLELKPNGDISTNPNRIINPDCMDIERISHNYSKAYTYLPLCTDYYNNFNVYNHISCNKWDPINNDCEANKEKHEHFLSVYNMYYWDFDFDRETLRISAKIHPISLQSNQRVRFYQWQNENEDSQRRARDWDFVTNYVRSARCGNPTSNTDSHVPFLYKLSDDRYIMSWSGYVTRSLASTTVSQEYNMIFFGIVEFNEKLHKLERITSDAYGGYLYNTTYPETAWMRSWIVVDEDNRIQVQCPYYNGTYYNTGQHILYNTPLSKKKLNDLAYKFGTNYINSDPYKHIYCYGVACHSALPDEKIKIIALIDNDNCGQELEK